MLIPLTEEEFNQHLELGFGDADSDNHWIRLGVCINQWDNGLGVGLLQLSTLTGTRVKYLHYQ